MTEESDFQNEILRLQADHGADWFLKTFVHMANDSNLSVGITLLVKGALVSGEIISGPRYFEELGKQFGASCGMNEEDGAALWKPLADDLYAKSESEEGADGDAGHDPSFIHLKNVRIFQAATSLPTSHEGVLWRGRLAEVDGFILGQLGAT
jgi:hypothetical protein